MNAQLYNDSPAETPLAIGMDSAGILVITLGPGWNEGDPSDALDIDAISASGPGSSRARFEEVGLDRQDAVVVSTLLDLIRSLIVKGFEVDYSTLPENIEKLVRISLAVPLHGSAIEERENRVVRIGKTTVEVLKEAGRFIEFLGELIYSFWRLLTGKARFRKPDFWLTLQECGVSALPIVALISVLIGVILGFVAGAQLQRFGATIYMVDLVGLAMAREMGCIMTGIIMSGRTGAAFAAQIGSMIVNEEVDALETLGFSPMEFLVLPRALAMILMMPLLTLFSNVLGWFGGFIVAMPLGISPAEYWVQLTGSMALNHIGVGLFKSFFFGIIVAGAGCYYGLLSGRSSAAVGESTTKAVVAGITWIILLDAIFAFTTNILGI